jgi:hypothetical protein
MAAQARTQAVGCGCSRNSLQRTSTQGRTCLTPGICVVHADGVMQHPPHEENPVPPSTLAYGRWPSSITAVVLAVLTFGASYASARHPRSAPGNASPEVPRRDGRWVLRDNTCDPSIPIESSCQVTIQRSSSRTGSCRVTIVCGGVTLYGSGGNGYAQCGFHGDRVFEARDLQTVDQDQDPAFSWSAREAKLFIDLGTSTEPRRCEVWQ